MNEATARIKINTLLEAAAVDRRLTPRFKSRDELLEEEFAKFVSDHTPARADGGRQSPVRQRRGVGLTERGAVGRPAGALWQMEGCP